MSTTPNLHAGTDFRIVVIEAGWVLAGEYSFDPVTKMATLQKSSVIQRWGTTKGLGELAICGVTADSVIHPTGIAYVPEHSVIFTLPVEQQAAATWPC